MKKSNHSFWDNQTVMLTGESRFLGSHLVEDLRSRSSSVNIFIPRSNKYDLRKKENIRRAFEVSDSDIVIHLAATVGGIGANQESPGRFFYDNAVIGIELIEQARQHNIDKFTIIGTICSYPKHTPVPFKAIALPDQQSASEERYEKYGYES